MPHYKDGTLARVGDRVLGTVYNHKGTKAGVIVSITSEADSCNAIVAFDELRELNEPALLGGLGEIVGVYQENGFIPNKVLYHLRDHTECKALTKIPDEDPRSQAVPAPAPAPAA